MLTSNDERLSLLGMFAEPSLANVEEDFQQFILFRTPTVQFVVLLPTFALTDVSAKLIEDLTYAVMLNDNYSAETVY